MLNTENTGTHNVIITKLIIMLRNRTTSGLSNEASRPVTDRVLLLHVWFVSDSTPLTVLELLLTVITRISTPGKTPLASTSLVRWQLCLIKWFICPEDELTIQPFEADLMTLSVRRTGILEVSTEEKPP